MTGSPWEQIWHNKSDSEELWDWIVKHDSKEEAIVNFGLDGGDDTMINEVGLVHGHAYSHLGHVTLSDGTRLIKCRNPWGGNEKYTGDWSDNSEKWTEEFKKEVGFEAKDDGIFYIELSDYH